MDSKQLINQAKEQIHGCDYEGRELCNKLNDICHWLQYNKFKKGDFLKHMQEIMKAYEALMLKVKNLRRIDAEKRNLTNKIDELSKKLYNANKEIRFLKHIINNWNGGKYSEYDDSDDGYYEDYDE